MIIEIKEMIAERTEGLRQEIAEITQAFQKRGGEATLSRSFIVRRDEIIVQDDIRIATD